MTRWSLGLLTAVLLAGCAVTPNPTVEAQRAEYQRTIPTCVTARDCEVKWAAARQWVLAHAGLKIQHITADYIETYNSPEYSGRLAMRLVKEPNGAAGYRFIITVNCSAGFMGCIPMSPWDAALAFNRAVNAAAP